MSKKSPLGAHLTKNLCRVQILPELWLLITLAKMDKMHHQTREVMVLGEKKIWILIACVMGRREPTPKFALKYGNFVTFFLYIWLWTPITLARVDKMNFFCPSPSHWGSAATVTKLLFWAFATAYLMPGKLKWDTVKGKNHPQDGDNAEEDGGRVWLHQDGQEDIRKAPFHGQFVHIHTIQPVSAVFSAKNAYQASTLSRLGV